MCLLAVKDRFISLHSNKFSFQTERIQSVQLCRRSNEIKIKNYQKWTFKEISSFGKQTFKNKYLPKIIESFCLLKNEIPDNKEIL